MHFLGHQLLVDMYGCHAGVLGDVDAIRLAMLQAAAAAGCTIITQTFHHFSPQGVSGAVIVAESHLAIHTWPEYGYAAVDVFTCGDSAEPGKAVAVLETALQATSVSATELRRGAIATATPTTLRPGAGNLCLRSVV